MLIRFLNVMFLLFYNILLDGVAWKIVHRNLRIALDASRLMNGMIIYARDFFSRKNNHNYLNMCQKYINIYFF